MFVSFPAAKFIDIGFKMFLTDDVIAYDIMDEWSAFHLVGQAPWYRESLEVFLVQNANVVSAVTSPLHSKFSNYRSDIQIVKNATLQNFNLMNSQEKRLRNSDAEKITAIYAGSLNENWIDIPLLWELVELLPNLQLRIAGQTKSLTVPEDIKSRVELLGWLDPITLSRAYKNADIGLVPFLENEISPGVDPIKVYDYLAADLKVAVFGLKHLENSPELHYFSSAAEFANNLESFLEFKSNRRMDIFWDNRAEVILNLMGYHE
jgi:glycosyltransferase involved in cell wall biosynthesis